MKISNVLHKVQIAIFIISTVLILSSAGWAKTYYIDTSKGNNNNDGGSISSPWETIGKANSVLQPGDTVYIRKGTYKETMRPLRSGKEGNYITYARYNDEEVTITGVSHGANLVDRGYITIDGIRIINVSGNWVNMEPNGHHNIIKNCYMEEAGDYKGINMVDNANYNKILNNTLIGYCGPSDNIAIRGGSYNLIEGNNISYGTHNSLAVYHRPTKYDQTKYNIVRNNFIRNKWHGAMDIEGSEYNLIENNTVVDSGEDYKNNSCGTERDRSMSRNQHRAIKLNTRYSIVRGNTLINNGYGFSLTSYDSSDERGDSRDNRIYHNSLYKNYRGLKASNYGYPATYNIIKNNIFYEQRGTELDIGSSDGENNYFINNNILGGEIRKGSGNIFTDNLALNPKFVKEVPDPDASGSDLHLQPHSPMIDEGAFLTKTTSSGSGATIQVENATYFMDGWGIIAGDVIQLEGQTKIARIKNVNYDNNTITIDQSISWNQGQGVSLAYNGSAPDIGAHESASVGSPPPAQTYRCSDGIDNDGDGLTDYPEDPGCSSVTDDDEYNAPPTQTYQCSDEFDNDGDGLTDYPEDPGCASITDNDEYNAPAPSITPFSQSYETENMNTVSPMSKRYDINASQGYYISPTSGIKSRSPVPEATLDFIVPEAGTYYLWLRMMGLDSDSDALYVGIDDTWDSVYPTSKNNYEWVRVEITHQSGNYGFNLSGGSHTMRIGHDEINPRADVLFITNYSDEVPSGMPLPPVADLPPRPPALEEVR
jgi:hypothetical protein